MVGDDCEPQGDTHLQDISPRALQVADEESFGLNEISHLAAHRCIFFDCDTITITSPRKPQDENLKSFTSRETEFLAFCHPYVRFFKKKKNPNNYIKCKEKPYPVDPETDSDTFCIDFFMVQII